MIRGLASPQVEPELKQSHHRRWLNGELQTIVATSAFGMGVNKADVRLVVHWTLPDSVEALYQEWGRAGRDGRPARCVLFYGYHDKGRVESLQRRSSADLQARLKRLIQVTTTGCALDGDGAGGNGGARAGGRGRAGARAGGRGGGGDAGCSCALDGLPRAALF